MFRVDHWIRGGFLLATFLARALYAQESALAELSLSVGAARANASLTGTAILSGPAPAGEAIVKLKSTDPAVHVPASVTIPAGQTSASFNLTTSVSLSSNSVAIVATYETSVKTALLTILLPLL